MEVYEIRPSPAKGLGAIATRPIPRGYRIVCEKPIMTAAREPGSINIDHIYTQFEHLSQEDQDKCLTLHAAQNNINHILQGVNKILPPCSQAQIAKVVSIFETNGFKMETSTESGMSGIFLTASKLNHSCTPNASQEWNSNIGCFTVHSIPDVAVGQEITISYIPLLSDRHQRRLLLKG